MTVDNTPVTHDELHAFVDGELPVDRQEAVTAWLATHPDDAALVAAWRAQADTIRARFGTAAGEKIPDRLALDNVIRNSARSGWRTAAAAAAIAALVAGSVGGAAGWMRARRRPAAPSIVGNLPERRARRAPALYRRSSPSDRSRRGGSASAALALAPARYCRACAGSQPAFDLTLLGGRLLPGAHSPAALFMYESASGERFTLYSSKVTLDRSGLRYNANEQFAAIHWIEGGYGYVVSGPVDKLRLKAIARAAYEQIENRRRHRRKIAPTFRWCRVAVVSSCLKHSCHRRVGGRSSGLFDDRSTADAPPPQVGL